MHIKKSKGIIAACIAAGALTSIMCIAKDGFPSTASTITNSPTAVSIMAPTAFGLKWGQIGVGFGYTNHWIGGDEDDGFGVVSMGLGEPDKVALTTSVLVDSVGGHDPFAKNGTVGFKLSHEFDDHKTAIAAGVANIIPWGTLNDDASSFYAVTSHVFDLNTNSAKSLPLTVSVGLGSGAFSSPEDFQNNKENIKPFGAVALKFHPKASLIADWTDSDLALGISLAPVESVPLVLGASVMNVIGEDSNAKALLFTAAVGFDFL